ncbi:GMC oxidoreductase [Maribacter sp. 2307ULW6-5]|uniref:GMC oxidoreductase n=1 Tax=Maribacter sp. 2307ULW6-5 TaxID=3386275 RepID=UPI0039BD3B8D
MNQEENAMIINTNEIRNGQIMVADVCIIGSGAAGIAIALQFIGTSKRVVVLTGGKRRETLKNRSLYKGVVEPKGTHEDLREKRRRAYGGSTLDWGGRCIPFDAIDFEKRDHVPFSGWPIDYDEVAKHYPRAMALCKAGEFNFKAPTTFPNTPKEILTGLDNEDIHSNALERWSTPVNFAKDYGKELAAAPNIKVLVNAHATGIDTAERKSSVSAISARAGEKDFEVVAHHYVLAAGAIENARILLASKNGHHPNGIGNEKDVVGRYYMCHHDGFFGAVAPKDRKSILYDFETDKDGVGCRRRWVITAKAQRERKMGNAVMFLHSLHNDEKEQDPLFSLISTVKWLRNFITPRTGETRLALWKNDKKMLLWHLKVVLSKIWGQLPQLIHLSGLRFKKRRLPFILKSVNSEQLGLYFQTEQVPHPDSRITLAPDRVDAHGMPLAKVQMAFNDMDVKTVVESYLLFKEQYLKNVEGEIHVDLKALDQFVRDSFNNFSSGSHQMGTTRMAADDNFGVVNADCRVHGMENLYVAGASVFPTGSHANPTLTIVALALRLAEHLIETDPVTRSKNQNQQVLS